MQSNEIQHQMSMDDEVMFSFLDLFKQTSFSVLDSSNDDMDIIAGPIIHNFQVSYRCFLLLRNLLGALYPIQLPHTQGRSQDILYSIDNRRIHVSSAPRVL